MRRGQIFDRENNCYNERAYVACLSYYPPGYPTEPRRGTGQRIDPDMRGRAVANHGAMSDDDKEIFAQFLTDYCTEHPTKLGVLISLFGSGTIAVTLHKSHVAKDGKRDLYLVEDFPQHKGAVEEIREYLQDKLKENGFFNAKGKPVIDRGNSKAVDIEEESVERRPTGAGGTAGATSATNSSFRERIAAETNSAQRDQVATSL